MLLLPMELLQKIRGHVVPLLYELPRSTYLLPAADGLKCYEDKREICLINTNRDFKSGRKLYAAALLVSWSNTDTGEDSQICWHILRKFFVVHACHST
jgi:hypothetical protein